MTPDFALLFFVMVFAFIAIGASLVVEWVKEKRKK